MDKGRIFGADRNEVEPVGKEHKESKDYQALGMSLGMCLGMSLGMCFGLLLFHNGPLGMSFGLSIGMLAGLVFGKSKEDAAGRQTKAQGDCHWDGIADDHDYKLHETIDVIVVDKSGNETVVKVDR